MLLHDRHQVFVSFWLSICVLLFYMQPICVFSSLATLQTSNGYTRSQKDFGSEKCDEDWEIKNGSQCVCASNETAKCKDEGGYICDNKGATYPSLCHFSLELCRREALYNRKIQSCGACETLRLRGSILGNKELFFVRERGDGFNSVFKCTDIRDLAIFYDSSVNVWVVGQRNSSGSYAAMLQQSKGTYPQDSEGGMWIAAKNGKKITFKLDLSTRIDCVKDAVSNSRRQKRFIFSLILGLTLVGLAATTVTTTLKIVQAKKGCLYYPSVCQLRDEVKHKLEPEVKKIRNDFLRKFPYHTHIKSQIDSVLDKVLNISNSLITIDDLYVQLNSSLTEVSLHSENLQSEFPEFKDVLGDYKNWMNGLDTQAVFMLAGWTVEFGLTLAFLPSLVAAGTSLFSMAMAGVGSVFAIGFSIADIISSVKQEKQIQTQLLSAKRSLLKAKVEFRKAFQDMEKFQKRYCHSVVKFLRVLAEKGKRYHTSFQSLYNLIAWAYGNSQKNCEVNKYYSKTNFWTLSSLDIILNQILNHLTKNVNDLKKKIREVKEMENVIAEIKKNIQTDKKHPDELYSFFTQHKPKIAEQLFPSPLQLLNYLSTNILPHTTCYWGYSLDKIRTKQITKHNYLQSPVCFSTEIMGLHNTIKNAVAQNQIPCAIANAVRGNVFRNQYLVLRYIADHILPTRLCYWGYDFTDIRKGNTAIDTINRAKIGPTIFSLLNYFLSKQITSSDIVVAKNMICKTSGVCSDKWQSFILCIAWQNHRIASSLNCSNYVKSRDECIPKTYTYQWCN